MGHSLVSRDGRSARWLGSRQRHRRRARRRSGVHPRAAGIPGRGDGLHRVRADPQGGRAAEPGVATVLPQWRWRLRRSAPCRPVHRGRGQPERRSGNGLLPDAAGRQDHRRGRPPLPAAPARAGLARHPCVAARAGLRRTRRTARAAAGGLPATGGNRPHAGSRSRCHGPRGHCRHRRGGAEHPSLGACPTGVGERASRARRWSRAHRLGLALAGPRDRPQGRPNLFQRM